MKKLKDKKGMTLLEVMAAGLVFAICSVLITTTLVFASDMYRRGEFFRQNRYELSNRLESKSYDGYSGGSFIFSMAGNSYSILGKYFYAGMADSDGNELRLHSFSNTVDRTPEIVLKETSELASMTIAELKSLGYPYNFYSNDALKKFYFDVICEGEPPIFDNQFFINAGIINYPKEKLYIVPCFPLRDGKPAPDEMVIFACPGLASNNLAFAIYNKEQAAWYWLPHDYDQNSGKPYEQWRPTSYNIINLTYTELKEIISKPPFYRLN